MLHRHDNGRVSVGATIRYALAVALPFWERFVGRGFAPGRAMTARERARWARWTLGGSWAGPGR